MTQPTPLDNVDVEARLEIIQNAQERVAEWPAWKRRMFELKTNAHAALTDAQKRGWSRG